MKYGEHTVVLCLIASNLFDSLLVSLARFQFYNLNLMEMLFSHDRGKIYIKVQSGSRILKDSHNSCFKFGTSIHILFHCIDFL